MHTPDEVFHPYTQRHFFYLVEQIMLFVFSYRTTKINLTPFFPINP